MTTHNLIRPLLDAFGRRRTRLLRRLAPADPFLAPPTDPAVLDLNPSAPVAELPPVRVTAGRFGPPPAAGLPALRMAVGERVGVEAERVLATHGAAGAFRTALATLVDPGRPVVLLAPCSPLFRQAVVAHGGRVRWVPTHIDGDRLRLDLDALSRAMRGAALLAAADPGNPIGLPVHADDADRLRWTAERSDVPLYVDETFRPPFAADRLAALAPGRTLIGGSLAASGFGSLRVGWLAGPAEMVRACEQAQAATAGPVPAVCQQAAWRVLTGEPPAPDCDAAGLAARLREFGLGAVTPAAGPFVWANVGRCGRSFAEELLTAEGVRVGPGDLYGPGGETHVRLSAATDPGRLREGLARLARFVGRPPRPLPAAKALPRRRPAFSR